MRNEIVNYHPHTLSVKYLLCLILFIATIYITNVIVLLRKKVLLETITIMIIHLHSVIKNIMLSILNKFHKIQIVMSVLSQYRYIVTIVIKNSIRLRCLFSMIKLIDILAFLYFLSLSIIICSESSSC